MGIGSVETNADDHLLSPTTPFPIPHFMKNPDQSMILEPGRHGTRPALGPYGDADGAHRDRNWTYSESAQSMIPPAEVGPPSRPLPAAS